MLNLNLVEAVYDMYLFLKVPWVVLQTVIVAFPGPEVIKLEFIHKLKIKSNDWLLADTCPKAAYHFAFFEFETVLKFSTVGLSAVCECGIS